jgi:spore maturation protein CgeB
MKILIVGAQEIYSLENHYTKYLREEGADVVVFDSHKIFSDYYKSFTNKIKFRLGLSSIYKTINRQLKITVTNIKPDVVWVFKGMELYPETIIWIKTKQILVVNYNPDNPFIFTGKGSGNSNVTKSIGYYDLHFTYNSDVFVKLVQMNIAVRMLPFGYELRDELFEETKRMKEISAVCFVGNPDATRLKFIRKLADNGIRINIYGYNWAKHMDHPNVVLHSAVFGDDFWRTLRSYRIQLNLLRIHNLNSHNMRTFEIPAVGGVMLAPRTIEHESFFSADREAFFYADTMECIGKIKLLLSMTPEKIAEFRMAARDRSVTSQYHYRFRAKQSLKDIGEFFSETNRQ